METLLNKVRKIEEEAAERIEVAERDGRDKVAEIAENESAVLEEIRAKADQRAGSIIDEEVTKANAEIGRLKQDEQMAVKRVHESGAENRAHAVEKAVAIFSGQYLGE